MKIFHLIALFLPFAFALDEAPLRDLKGSSSSGGDTMCPSKGIGPQWCNGGCQELALEVKLSEFETSAANTTATFSAAPLYQKVKGKGKKEVGTANFGGTGNVMTFALTFNKNTIITGAGVEGANILAITGGSGKVPGAAGQMKVDEAGKKTKYELYLCSNPL